MPKGIDESILEILQFTREADIYTLSEKLRLPIDYIEEVCSSLVEEGCLEQTDRWGYALTKSERRKRKGPSFVIRF